MAASCRFLLRLTSRLRWALRSPAKNLACNGVPDGELVTALVGQGATSSILALDPSPLYSLIQYLRNLHRHLSDLNGCQMSLPVTLTSLTDWS